MAALEEEILTSVLQYTRHQKDTNVCFILTALRSAVCVPID